MIWYVHILSRLDQEFGCIWMGIFPVVHASKIKPVKIFPARPVARLEEPDGDRVDFDEALLSEASWIQDRDPDEYEVDQIFDI
ncbi:hypothetical protein PHMEG_00031360 [Phytophthora megakarya]|uniref:Reverse transcriptase n=1 Tax=Phytophthora megakarya TaxID=4795 RepID=A0A225UZH1_9STRA|nr:hypothetical protein PHMEG_00031360 [Phytophthora megakarya]